MVGPAELDWNGRAPVSRRFGDIYFHPEDGPAESRHVFLDGNDLALRFERAERGPFLVGELGFGTGLNFLLTRDLFLRNAAPGARLCYVACELCPIAAHDLWAVYARLGGGVPGAADLIERMPAPLPGFTRLIFDIGRVSLTLFLGTVDRFVAELEPGHGIEAWFLDGFAPAKNRDMWSAGVMSALAGLSAASATLATFSVAGAVRRNLEAAGFSVERRTGFGRKREMLVGRLTRGGRLQPSWRPTSVRIFGAGLAGTFAAEAFARRGIGVQVVSGPDDPPTTRDATVLPQNPALLTHPRLMAADLPEAMLSWQSLQYLTGWLRAFPKGEQAVVCRGSVRLLPHAREQKRTARALELNRVPPMLARIIDAHEASDLLGIRVSGKALFVPSALAVRPGELSVLLPSSPSEADAGLDVIAAGAGSAGLLAGLGVGWIPLHPLSGQVALLPAPPGTSRLRMAACFDGYALPLPEGIVLGSTYERIQPCPPPRAEVSTNLLSRFTAAFPDDAWVGSLPASAANLRGWTGVRVTTPDRLPVVGMVQTAADRPCAVLTGFGSRGLLTAPLGAEVLASLCTGEPAPIARPLLDRIHPNRFRRRGRDARA